jgi:hypothetical protein
MAQLRAWMADCAIANRGPDAAVCRQRRGDDVTSASKSTATGRAGLLTTLRIISRCLRRLSGVRPQLGSRGRLAMPIGALFARRITDAEFDEMLRLAVLEVPVWRASEVTPWTHPSLLGLVKSELMKTFGSDRFWWSRTLKAIRHFNPASIDGVKEIVAKHDESKRGNFRSEVTCKPDGWRPDVVSTWLRQIAGYHGHYVIDVGSYVDDVRPSNDRWRFEMVPPPARNRAIDSFAHGLQGCVTHVGFMFEFATNSPSDEATVCSKALQAGRRLLLDTSGPSAPAALQPYCDFVLENQNVSMRIRGNSVYPKDHIGCYQLDLTRPNRPTS